MDSAQYAREVGRRLRRARMNRLMSLAGVAEASGGRWAAETLGTWERADRALKVEELDALARFYKLGVRDLLPPDVA